MMESHPEPHGKELFFANFVKFSQIIIFLLLTFCGSKMKYLLINGRNYN